MTADPITATTADPSDEPRDSHWRERALCAQTDPQAFFPELGASAGPAKAVCINCEVRLECLDDALTTGQNFGVWGGMSERERRRIKAGHLDRLAPVRITGSGKGAVRRIAAARAAHLRATGQSVQDIAIALDASESTVRRYLGELA